MSEIKLDGYCGLYCGACDVYRLSQKAEQSGVPASWAEMPERFRKTIKPAEIVCHGCKSDTLFAGCRACPIIKCAKKKGVESCGLCRKYPCFNFTLVNAVVWLRRLNKKLPHVVVRQPNLEFIRQFGRDVFLSQQQRAWCCPQCGSPLSWYQEKCPSCGKEVESVR